MGGIRPNSGYIFIKIFTGQNMPLLDEKNLLKTSRNNVMILLRETISDAGIPPEMVNRQKSLYWLSLV